MSDILSEVQNHIQLITFNRVEKHNAFDDSLLAHLQLLIDDAQKNPKIRVIILKSHGKHFSAGADAAWMQRMVTFDEQKNHEDALVLAQAMHTLYESTKPIIAMPHGAAFGGGAGIVAACDIAIAADDARFCFSEVRLGLVPAVISPYVIKAIGERTASALFMSAEVFSAKRAYELKLVHQCVAKDQLLAHTLQYAENIAALAPKAVPECKELTRRVSGKAIDADLQDMTASIIAKRRISSEGQKGLKAFLDKKTPNWD